MSTILGLLSDFDLPNIVASASRKPKVVYWAAAAAIFKNLYDVILPHWAFQYGWSLATLCRISCRLRWCGQSRNRKKNFNMVDVFLQNGNSYISVVHWVIIPNDSKIAPQRPPSWKSVSRHISAASDPILVKCGMLTQNDMIITAMRSKSKLKNMTDWKRKIAHWSCR